MLSVTIEYNRRMARHNQALTGAEVRNKICESMVAAAIFECVFGRAPRAANAAEERRLTPISYRTPVATPPQGLQLYF
jgi:hypothetical protein